MKRLDVSIGEKSKLMPRIHGRPWDIERRMVWERGNIIKWIKSCRADKGQPRFIQFGEELEKAHKITAVCWGGYNRDTFAKTVTFIGIGDQDKLLLMDKNRKDWIQLINKYGAQDTKVELLHKEEGVMDLRLKCDECCSECE